MSPICKLFISHQFLEINYYPDFFSACPEVGSILIDATPSFPALSSLPQDVYKHLTKLNFSLLCHTCLATLWRICDYLALPAPHNTGKHPEKTIRERPSVEAFRNYLSKTLSYTNVNIHHDQRFLLSYYQLLCTQPKVTKLFWGHHISNCNYLADNQISHSFVITVSVMTLIPHDHSSNQTSPFTPPYRHPGSRS